MTNFLKKLNNVLSKNHHIIYQKINTTELKVAKPIIQSFAIIYDTIELMQLFTGYTVLFTKIEIPVTK